MKRKEGNVPVVVADDVRMTKFSEDVDFSDKLLFFFFRHAAVVEFFPDKSAAIRLSANFADDTKRAFTNVVDDFVVFHVMWVSVKGKI